MGYKEDIRVTDSIRMQRCWHPKGPRGGGAPPIPGPKLGLGEYNVRVTLRDKPNGKIVEERRGHNIFLNYGREWLAELCGIDTGGTPFRNDRVSQMAFGIGGETQLVPSITIRGTWLGFPNAWGYTDTGDLSTGGYGSTGGATGDPAQTDTDPAVTGLEYPVQVMTSDYYATNLYPNTFPEAGTIRFTSVLGYNQVSFGLTTSVPISEIGLFTEGASIQDNPPLDDGVEVNPPNPSKPPLGVRYMVAYNTFDTLSKTSAFVLQTDWELRFA